MLVHLIIVGVTVFDLLSKLVVQSRFEIHEKVVLIPGLLNFTYVRNWGAAFGILQGHRWPLIAVSVGMLVFLVHSRKSFLKGGRVSQVGYGLMCGGIIGNLVDRVRQQYVVDFIDVHWAEVGAFPTFNIADSAICVGVGLFLLQQYLEHRRHTRADWDVTDIVK